MLSILKLILLVIGVSLIAVSCERVIHVGIQDAPSQYVVEGILTDDSVCRVRVSMTGNFYDSLNLSGVNNAHVTITEEGKTPVVLMPASERGIYRAKFTGRPGRTYHLRVEHPAGTSNSGEVKVFTATSTMPRKVRLDSLYITQRLFLGQTRNIATIRFKDPAELGNAYRFIQYVDGRAETTIFIAKDDLFNGRMVTDELLIFNNEYTLKKCDQVRVEMQCIDQPNYLFWYSLSQGSLGSSQSASPGNPVSNIKGGALGHFSAHTVSALNIAVFPDSTCSYPAD
ncbi:DUF4249 domain-containing protein [Niabella aquatica]